MSEEPLTTEMVAYEDANDRVRAVYEDIMATKGIDWIPNFWKVLATHPPMLESVWESIKSAMGPGRIDPLTKEMIALAVSATNNCAYCLESHTAAARKLGMDDDLFGELMAVVGAFNRTNALASGYRVPPDERLTKAARRTPEK